MRGESFSASDTALLDIPNFSAIRLIDTYSRFDDSALFINPILQPHFAAVNEKFPSPARKTLLFPFK